MIRKRFIRSTINKVLNNFGFTLERASPQRHQFFVSRNVDTVVDVGANIGQFGREIRDFGFEGQIYSFEPMAKAYKMLIEEIGNDDKWKAYNIGISDHSGNAVINVSELSVFSSLHKLKSAAGVFDPRSSYISSEDISLDTISNFSPLINGSNIFLKIDTQGHEAAVLKGMNKFVDRVVGIQLELPIVNIYDQEWNISNYIEYMRSIGFAPAQFQVVNHHPSDRVSALEIDCVFRRINSDID